MSQPELVRALVKALVDSGTEYMLTGSVVSSLQGEPRASHDIDVVVHLSSDHVKKLITAFPSEDFYVNEDAVREAVKRSAMFNIISLKEQEKLDFWMLRDDDAYDRSRFSRKHMVALMGTRANVSLPEDTILYKLRWAVLSGGSEKQFGDALRVYEVQFRNLDMAYLDHWAVPLGVTALLERIKKEANSLQAP
ncbi:MAG: hypothetical protein V1899_12525 [Planctomycetota bacterium]